jgi:histidinol-phosphate/aromatic aminotransferase/cobyric acid decarboxylase-like protein
MNRPESDLVHDIHCYFAGARENILIGAGSDGILQQEFDVLSL